MAINQTRRPTFFEAARRQSMNRPGLFSQPTNRPSRGRRFLNTLRNVGNDIPIFLQRARMPQGRRIISGTVPIGPAGALNVLQTAEKLATFTPLATAAQGKLLLAAKQFAGAATTGLVIQKVAENAFNYGTGREIDLIPSKGQLVVAGLGGLSPFGHFIGAGAGILYEAGKAAFRGGKNVVSSVAERIPESVPSVTNIDYGTYYTGAKEKGTEFVQAVQNSVPDSIPVSVSVGGGGGVGAGEIAALLAALTGGYLLGKRKKKKHKSKKKRRSRKR